MTKENTIRLSAILLLGVLVLSAAFYLYSNRVHKDDISIVGGWVLSSQCVFSEKNGGQDLRIKTVDPIGKERRITWEADDCSEKNDRLEVGDTIRFAVIPGTEALTYLEVDGREYLSISDGLARANTTSGVVGLLFVLYAGASFSIWFYRPFAKKKELSIEQRKRLRTVNIFMYLYMVYLLWDDWDIVVNVIHALAS